MCGGQRCAVKTNPIRPGFPGDAAIYGLALGAAALRLKAAECVDGAVPVALGGLLAAEDLGESVAALGILSEDGAEGMLGLFEGGHARGDDGGLDAVIAAAHPDGADDGFEEVGFDGADGVELLFIVGGELIELGGIFAGDDHGLGGKAELEGVAAGDGLALDGARPGGQLSVGAIGVDLRGSCHDSLITDGQGAAGGWDG